MYVYKKKINRKKVYVFSSIVLMVVAGIVSWQFMDKTPQNIPVMKEEFVITLPDKKEKIMLPFNVEATLVLEYFDGSNHEVKDYTNLNGVYRPNQGIDYAFNDETFEILSMLSGEVIEVKEDELFGNTITIKNKDLFITYQSLSEVSVKVKDTVKQGDVLGKAGKNTYNPELGNHLHLVVENKGIVVNPKSILDKTIEEI